jgi:phosphatidylglycerophosphatase A
MNGRMLLLTAFGLGRLRPGPGTWGSLLPIVFVSLLIATAQPFWLTNLAIALLGLLFAVACLRFGTAAEQEAGAKDPQFIVADEVAGQCLPLLLLPLVTGNEAWSHNLPALGIAFITFRGFDIAKPWPIRQLQRGRGGLGILIDDIVAGLFAAIVTQMVVRVALRG